MPFISSNSASRVRRALLAPSSRSAAAALSALAIALLGGCTPQIGDKCVLSTDCSTRGDRLCDTSQKNGYCTQFNCSKNSCPNAAACILFESAIPGCGYDDRSGAYGSRAARSFCVASCTSDSDCRTGEGYVCADPKALPWNGLVLDDDQGKRTCMVARSAIDTADTAADTVLASTNPPPVCGTVGPDVKPIDASAPRSPTDASGSDAGGRAAGDAGTGDAGDGGDGG